MLNTHFIYIQAAVRCIQQGAKSQGAASVDKRQKWPGKCQDEANNELEEA